MIICLHLHFFFKPAFATQSTKARRRHQHPARRRKVAATNNTHRMWSTSRCRAQKLLCTSHVLLSLPVGTPGNSMYIACSSCARAERTAASLRGERLQWKIKRGILLEIPGSNLKSAGRSPTRKMEWQHVNQSLTEFHQQGKLSKAFQFVSRFIWNKNISKHTDSNNCTVTGLHGTSNRIPVNKFCPKSFQWALFHMDVYCGSLGDEPLTDAFILIH